VLKSLKLKNVALIEIIEINFEKGLNVFTGESGSGKSLVLDSLNSLFGGTNIPLNHLIRPGSNECSIEARFDISSIIRDWLLSNKFQLSTDEITVLRKTCIKNNKIVTSFSVNQLKVKKRTLQTLGLLLIDFAGHNDNLLFNSQDHLKKIIDDFGFEDLKALSLEVRQTFFKLDFLRKDINSKLAAIKNDKENYFAREQLLKILEEANLNDVNEISKLKIKELKLSNNYELQKSLNQVLINLSNSGNDFSSASLLIGESIKQINKIIKYDENLNSYSSKLIALLQELEDLIIVLNDYLNSIDNESEDLDVVQNRLFKLQNLEKTFSSGLSDLIAKRDSLKDIPPMDLREKEINSLEKDYEVLMEHFRDIINIQSSKRKLIASQLEKNVIKTLKLLGLPNASFSISFDSAEPNVTGKDSLKFLFSANPDQPPSPISQTISGGEMSRFLLALKSNMLNLSNTLFLDEIDNGLSGKSLFALVNLIKEMSLRKQILCITHHPLLAAAANVHYKVQKNINKGLTFTSLSKLTTNKQKQNELAELIGGGFEEASDYALTLIKKTAA